MTAKQKETAAKWVLASGAMALLVVSLTWANVETPLDTTSTPGAPAAASSEHGVADSYRHTPWFIATLC